MRDPYESLAVPRSATAADIKKSFRELAKRLHPDANNNDPKAAALFAELTAAHEILSDEEKRRAFDQGAIDAEGKPRRGVIASRYMPGTWHIVTRLVVVMVMLATTSTLIMRGLTPEERVNATNDGGNRDLSPIGANEEHAPAAQREQRDPGARSESRLILQQSVSHAGADSVPIGIQVGGKTDGLALEISGLPSGTTISSGRQLPGGAWRILAADVGNAVIRPPAGFNGTIDLAVELRLIDDTVIDHGSLHLEWLPKPAKAPDPTESAAAAVASESSADKALATAAPTDPTSSQRVTDSHRDRESIDHLIGRSEKLISEGDVEAARILLQPAAEAHDARAALALGATYDPIMLAILQARGIAADVSLALDWYKKAQEFGSQEAKTRLKLLSAALVAPKRHVIHRPIRAQAPIHAEVSIHVGASTNAPALPQDPTGVYVAGERVGSDPDPNIRAQLLRDDASRQLRTGPNGVSENWR